MQGLTENQIQCLSDKTRRKILKILHQKPEYPVAIAKKLNLQKQKVYYHIKKLEENNLIEEERKENLSGGTATYYRPTRNNYNFTMNLETLNDAINTSKDVENFLSPLIKQNEINGKIIVGSPDEHGPDQVRARDGHLAAEISQVIGRYGSQKRKTTFLDTEINPEINDNLLLLGGILTNTATKEFNNHFKTNFSDEKFPYRELETPETTYSKPTVGVISKNQHHKHKDKFIYLVAGIRNKGTQAASLAFKNLEEILDNYKEGEYYIVVKGLDLDGDGEIDNYEILEKKQL